MRARVFCRLAVAVACCVIEQPAGAEATLCLERPPSTEAERVFCSAVLKSNKDDRAGAIADFERALALQPDMADAHFLLGYQYWLEKNYVRAIAEYDEYLRVHPESARAWANRGGAYLELGDLAAVREDADRALELQPADPILRENRLYVSNAQGDTATIIVDATWLLRNLPPNPAWLDLRGSAFAREKRYEEALADAERLVELRPDANAYCNRGSTRLSLNQDEAAEKDLSKALRLDPELELGYIKRCMARYRLQRYTEALPDCEAYVRRVPGDSYGHYLRGLMRDRTGDHDGAIADYRRAIELTKDPDAIANAWYGVGLANERAGRLDAGRDAYRRALEVVPDHSLSRKALDRLSP